MIYVFSLFDAAICFKFIYFQIVCVYLLFSCGKIDVVSSTFVNLNWLDYRWKVKYKGNHGLTSELIFGSANDQPRLSKTSVWHPQMNYLGHQLAVLKRPITTRS